MNTVLAAERLEELESEAPDALRLARLVSLAVRVERHLLRRLRLELLPGADVGIEADLWFSPIVESRGSGAFVIDPACALLLRCDLAREGAMLTRAAAITKVEHRHAPASIQLEERVHAIAARGGDDVLTRIDEALAPALRALREADPRGKDVARWAMRALPRFDPLVRESGAALALLLGASTLLGGRRIVRDPASSRASLKDLGWAIPATALSERVRVAVEVSDDAVRFVEDPGDAPVLDLPRTTPRLLEVSWPQGEDWIVNIVEAEFGNSLQIEPGISALTLRALDGSEYLLKKESAAHSPSTRRPTSATAPVCYVTMGFGVKTDYSTGRKLDLDKSYRLLIKPAAEAAGLKCVRADEIVHSGAIDLPMYEHLLTADVVIADLSTANPNALYDLGVRHALRPRTTIVISESKLAYPFDLSHISLLAYNTSGDAIDYEEVKRFRGLLEEALTSQLSGEQVDSPIYTFLRALQPPAVRSRTESASPATQSRTENADAAKRPQRCYVVMGFGVKTDYATGRKLDLDKSYRLLIKPAVEEQGLECVRADEIRHSGTIDVPMYEQLLTADVVIVDLSTVNSNALYELGLRHALRPRTTIVMAEDQFPRLFDPARIPILSYRHMGDGIDFDEVERVRSLLSQTLASRLSDPQPDSPVYTFLRELTPPTLVRPSTTSAESATIAPEPNANARPAVNQAAETEAPALARSTREQVIADAYGRTVSGFDLTALISDMNREMNAFVAELTTVTKIDVREAYYFFLGRLGRNYDDYRFAWEPFRDFAGPLLRHPQSIPIVMISVDRSSTMPDVKRMLSPKPYYQITVSPSCMVIDVVNTWLETLSEDKAIPQDGGERSYGWFFKNLGISVEKLSPKAQRFVNLFSKSSSGA